MCPPYVSTFCEEVGEVSEIMVIQTYIQKLLFRRRLSSRLVQLKDNGTPLVSGVKL